MYRLKGLPKTAVTLGVGLVLGLGLGLYPSSVMAKNIPEIKVVNGEEVLTNSGEDFFRKRVVKKAGKTVISNNKPQPSVTTNSQPRAFRRPDGTVVLPDPKVTTTYTYSTVGSNWAFATFKASARLPRMVRYYGWTRNEDGTSQRAWVDTDLNQVILKHARAYNIDPLLVEILIRYESNFDPQVVSPAGAIGLTQLMPGTAAGLGVSDPYDVEQNVEAGVHYLAIQMERFGYSVPLALAAYNAGPGSIEEYGGVPPYAETRYYVDAIYGDYLAAKSFRDRTR